MEDIFGGGLAYEESLVKERKIENTAKDYVPRKTDLLWFLDNQPDLEAKRHAIEYFYYSGLYDEALRIALPIMGTTSKTLIDKQIVSMTAHSLLFLGKAQDVIDLSPRFDPKDASLWTVLANAHGILRQFDDQLAAGQSAIIIEPKSAHHWSALGFIYHQRANTIHGSTEDNLDFESSLGTVYRHHAAACLARAFDLLSIDSKSAKGFALDSVMERMKENESEMDKLAEEQEGLREEMTAMTSYLAKNGFPSYIIPANAAEEISELSLEDKSRDSLLNNGKRMLDCCYPYTINTSTAFEEQYLHWTRMCVV